MVMVMLVLDLHGYVFLQLLLYTTVDIIIILKDYVKLQKFVQNSVILVWHM
jgi:hypothetical protein